MEVGLLSNIDNLTLFFFNYYDRKQFAKIFLLINFNLLVNHILFFLYFL